MAKKRNPKKKAAESHPWARPLSCIIYGESGIGKTSFAASFDRPAFIIDPNEGGIYDLVASKQMAEPMSIEVVQDFNELKEIGERLAPEFLEAGIKTAVFDSLTGLEYLCFQRFCDDEYNGDWSKEGFMAYYQGPRGAAKSIWPQFLMSLNDLTQVGIDVILVGHSQIKPFNNPATATYDKFTPYLDKETWQQTHRWASMVLFMNMEVETETEGIKTKASQNALTRNVYTEPSPIFDAKNRHGMEPLFEAGDTGKECYQNFVNSFPKL